MTAKETKQNVILYQLFTLFNEPLFWGPILIISLQELAHMSLSYIYFMESITVIICVLLDIPSGALADVIGKKKLLIAGRILLLISITCFAIMSSPMGAWIGNIVWAIGYSFQSGTDTSLLYTSLKNGRSQMLFKKIEGRATGRRFALTAFCSLSVSALVVIHPRLPMIASIFPMIVPLIVATKFTEPTHIKKYEAKKQLQTLISGMTIAIKNPHVRWIIGFSAFIAGISKIWFFTYNPYFEKVNIPIKYYGVIFFLLNITAWISSFFTHTITKNMREKTILIGMIGCIVIPILLMGLIPWWPLALLVLSQNVVRGMAKPYIGDFIHRHIESEEVRTTVLSTQSSASNIISIISLVWFGYITDTVDLLSSLIILGSVGICIGILGMWRYNKNFST